MAEEIVGLLSRVGAISEENLRYARRVQQKLSTPKTLLGILQELQFITPEQVQVTLRSNHLTIRLGSLLVELGYLRESDLEMALAIQSERPGIKLGQILVEGNFIGQDDLIEVLSYQLGFPRLAPNAFNPDLEFLRLASVKWFRSNECVPLARKDGTILVAFADPMDTRLVESVRRLLGGNITAGIARRDEIHQALDRLDILRNRGTLELTSENAIIQTVNEIISEAADAGASDVHVEPLKDRLRIRFRKDGVLYTFREFPQEVIPPLISRMKLMAGADIAEKRRHQDGRIMFDHHGMPVDIRVSTYGSIHAETIVMRLLNNREQLFDFRDLGMTSRTLQRYVEEALEAPSGVLIVTGPTGSGKTTTLYSSVHHLNNPQTSIITAEDPVEYIFDGISQCSINPKINVTFEDTLRHMVRQDPDVIVIGEIRDRFSAETAIQAALTGHKVLTTFHTEDSVGALIRLLNMDIEAFLIASTVVCVIAQRLLRKVCPGCAQEQPATPQQLRRLGYEPRELPGITFKVGRGCTRCRYRGYSGRVGVYELLVPNELVKDAILAKKTTYEIRRLSLETAGLVTLLEDGIYKAAQGSTSYDEIIRQLPRLSKPRPVGELHRLLGD